MRNRIAENGYEAIKQKFSYTRLVEDMRELYLRLLENNEIN